MSKGLYELGVKINTSTTQYHDPDGMETIEDYDCDSSCPIRILNEQSGHLTSRPGKTKPNGKGQVYFTLPHVEDGPKYNDQGGASRYFQTFHYFSKASRTERNAGCEGLPEKPSKKLDGGVWAANVDYAGPQGTSTTLDRYAANNHPTVKSLSLMSWLCRLITPPGGTVLDCFCGSGSTLVACVKEGFHFIGIEQEQSYIDIAHARISHALQQSTAYKAVKEV